ncbi:MAG: ABC transporter substrate-binding protein [Caldisericia bacterium]
MRRIISILLSLSMVLMLFASVMPVGAEEEHALQKYINYVTEESILPGVENPDDVIPADTFSAGLSLVLGKDLEYTGENFTRAEMFKFAIDSNDAIKNDVSEYDFPAWCLALDEESIPEEYVPYFNMAARPFYNLLTYRYRETAWAEAPSYAEAAFLLYRTQFPPNTDPEQVLTCVTQQEPDTLNPFVSSSMSRTFLVRFMGTGGIEYGDDSILFPKALKRVPSLENDGVVLFHDEIPGKDKMTVTYELRPGIYWPALPDEPEGSRYHEVTADDVIYGVREGMCPILQATSRSGDWKIDKVTKLNKYTVEVQFNEMYAYAAWGLPGLSYKAMYETELITDPDNHNVRQDYYDYTFGPYKMTEWNEGNYFDFEPNPYAAYAQPLIPKIRVKFMSDANTIKLNLRAGDIDMVYNAFSPLDAKEIEDDLSGIYKFHYVEGTGWEHIDLNQFTDDPDSEDDLGLEDLFGDKRVRQALLYALDREKLCKLVSQGVFSTSHLWLTRRSKYYKKAEEMNVFKK